MHTLELLSGLGDRLCRNGGEQAKSTHSEHYAFYRIHFLNEHKI